MTAHVSERADQKQKKPKCAVRVIFTDKCQGFYSIHDTSTHPSLSKAEQDIQDDA